MPTLSKDQREKATAKNKRKTTNERHPERMSNSVGSEAYCTRIDQGISIPGAMKIKQGRGAMEAEWNTIECPEGCPPALDVIPVESNAEVMKRASETCIEYHFSSIVD